jgi:excisionase family DNA binding protein
MTDGLALTIPAACASLGIERDEMEQLIAAGKIQDFTLRGNRRIAIDELDRYVRENKTDAEGRRQITEGKK